MSITTINSPAKRPRHHEDWQINFSTHEKKIIEDNGNNPIVISFFINNFLVDIILVYDGGIVEVLFYNAFKKINLDESLLSPVGSIYDFANQSIKVK